MSLNACALSTPRATPQSVARLRSIWIARRAHADAANALHDAISAYETARSYLLTSAGDRSRAGAAYSALRSACVAQGEASRLEASTWYDLQFALAS